MTQSPRPLHVLHIDSSALRDHSVSRHLSAALVEQWRRADPSIRVQYRDLAADPLAHLDSEILEAQRVGAALLSDWQRREHALSEALIEEFMVADVIIVGAPMYNFAISSQLKAWIDRIVRAGRTFRYTETGPIGLAAGKRVVIISSRGGIYATPEKSALDFQEAYLRLIFGFIGITDISIIRAEGLAMGSERRAAALDAAQAQLADLFRDAA